jgi:uroporphyrinogen-III decarboxylase
MTKTPEELYQERVKRVLDVVALKTPDRVPVFGPYQLFPYTFADVTLKDAMNDYAVARKAAHTFVDEFQPDLDFGPILAYPAKPMETLGLKWFKWPGHGMGDHVMYQYVEGEYMKADEYDEFLTDPSHYMMSKWVPRSFKGLEAFKDFPAMRRMMWFGFTGLGPMASPEMRQALDTAVKAGQEVNEWFDSIFQYVDEIKKKGFPLAWSAFNWPPFDIIGDTLRGTRGILQDIMRQPDKLLKALEITTQIFVEYGSGAAGAELPLCWIWMHKGTGKFMSPKQFETFYWPWLKKGMLALIDQGIIPVLYCEADVENRLEYFKELPKGKTIIHVAQTDLAKAKAALGDTACIMGNVPNIIMQAGTTDDVKDYCKKAIDVAGKDGGFIMDTAVMLDEAKPENLKTMIDFTKEYGVYR